ncbi:uncharacterized protein LOC113795245 [Dermatophagoides pteronyssinus]|uniref:uncharacterized protein LOC113795245 n=1 Tax=Dermatophagoides pteronyssinus TaxID=6956 RepID=UPI003F66E198
MFSLNNQNYHHHHHPCHCHCHHHHHQHYKSQCNYCLLDHLDDNDNMDDSDFGKSSSSFINGINDQQQQKCQCLTTTTTMATSKKNVSIISNNQDKDNHLINKMMKFNQSAAANNNEESDDNNSFVHYSNSINLYRNLLILTFLSSILFGILQNLFTIDHYIYHYSEWTTISLAIGFMFNALSVYYAQIFVEYFGLYCTILFTIISIILFIFIHYFINNFHLFQSTIILMSLLIGPFYSAQLEFLSKFLSNLTLTTTIKHYRNEHYQRIFHLILFCPSFIVGHLIYVIIFALNTSSSSSTSKLTSSLHQINGSKFHYNNNHESSTWTLSSSTSIKPICLHLFRQQYCDHAFYYIFSNHHHHNIRLSSSSSDANHHSKSVSNQFDNDFIKILITIFIIISLIILSIVIVLLNRIDQQQRRKDSFIEHSNNHSSYSIRNNIIFRTFRDNHLRLLLPMAFFIGFEQGFFMADYNKLYVSCALGLKSIGSIMLIRGLIHLGSTLLILEFIHHIQRPIILLAGTVCQLSVLTILYLWHPNDDIPLYYVITITYSLANAIMETLLLTNVLRTFCPDEWKYSFLTIYSMNNLGLAIAFAISEFICLYIKIYSLIIILIFACIPMQLCELRLMKFEKILGPGSQSQL